MSEKDETTKSALGRRLTEYLERAFESVYLTRRDHFANNPSARPTQDQVDRIIKSYANQNALIAGGANLIPGPWGALTIVPEITLILRNQIQMMYDLGVARGQEAKLTPHALLALFSTSVGGGAISLATVKGGQLLIKRASLRVIQRIIRWLGGKIAQRVLRAFLAKWVPIVGAGAMAIWARQSTIAIGRKAGELLKHDLGEDAGDVIDV
jgi:uncharacterized protein (DUF697 family)